jgi:hypothetical protein
VLDGCVRLLKTVFHQQMQIVPLVEDLAFDIRIELPKPANFPILLGDELLTHRRDLDVDVIFREVEVGSEEFRRFAVCVPIDGEGLGLVGPIDLIEIEESREFPLAVVGEIGVLRP